MATQTPTDPAGGDERLLQSLALLTEVIRRRVSTEDGKPDKSWWQYIVEPVVLTSLITVIIGGLFGSAITAIYQEEMKTREAQQAAMMARGDQALVWYKDHLSQEQGLLGRAFSLVGECVSASDRLISQTGPAFRQKFRGDNKKSVEKQQNDIKHGFNETKAKWHKERVELSYLLGYYFAEQTDVPVWWSKVDGSVTSYLDCAERWNNSHQLNASAPTEEETRNACKSDYDDLSGKVGELTKRLEAARQYPWKQTEIK
jgi:hypothetical protein